jgi:phage terminase large subunit-like protein
MPGHIVVYKAIQDDGSSYWPEFFPVDVLNRWLIELGPVSFPSQYQSSPVDLSGDILKREWLHWYDYSKIPEEFEKIIFFIDPAISQKKTADYFALAVAGKYNNQIYLLDLLRTRASIAIQHQLIDDKYAVWMPNEIIVEAGGPQLYFVDYLKEHTMYNILIPEPNWHRSDKKIRFETAAAHFNAGRALLPGYKDDINRWQPIDSFQSFVDEWVSFPSGLHDDTVDAVSGAVSSMIMTSSAASFLEPDEYEETLEFVTKTYEDVHNRSLTPEEIEALEEYYNNDGVGTVRRMGFFR